MADWLSVYLSEEGTGSSGKTHEYTGVCVCVCEIAINRARQVTRRFGVRGAARARRWSVPRLLRLHGDWSAPAASPPSYIGALAQPAAAQARIHRSPRARGSARTGKSYPLGRRRRRAHVSCRPVRQILKLTAQLSAPWRRRE